ncbi:MAG: VWA domain-containing protein [Acidobacteriota bacterium]|nr:VWA domain-containing protein [Blastocatellia bacterium]MDW8240423.1 VWA domain-containing protein [Acidobacteriota bacterium]
MKRWIAMLWLVVGMVWLWPTAGSDGPRAFDSTLAPKRGVRLFVSVWDQAGKPVTNLTKDDFTVLEEGRPQPIQQWLKPTAPLRLVLMIDTSESMAYAFARLQEGLQYFVSLLGPFHELAVVSFARSTTLETDFSVDPERIKRTIARLSLTVERQEITRFYDAIESVVNLLRDSSQHARAAVLLYTDGEDQGSKRQTRNSSLQLAAQRQIPFYVVRAKGMGSQSYLNHLAEVTAGQLIPADKFLERELERLAQHLTSCYVLEYTSEATYKQNKPVRVQVKVSNPAWKVSAPSLYRTAPEE